MYKVIIEKPRGGGRIKETKGYKRAHQRIPWEEMPKRESICSRHTEDPDFNPVGHPFLGKRLNIVTTYGYPPDECRWSYDRSVALTIDLLANRRLNIRPMLTHQFDWQDLPQVYRRLDEGDASILGTVIHWGDGNGTLER